MALSREKKVEIAANVDGLLKKAVSVVFVNFHGLSVVDTGALRKKLREEGVSYHVAKKSLIRRSLEKAGIRGEMPVLDGEVALAYGEDAIAPARGIQSFVKQYKDALSILGGIFEGSYQDKAAMTEIAGIPSPQVLYGQLAHVINSPIQGFVVALWKIAETKVS